jgi:hypothetical protein
MAHIEDQLTLALYRMTCPDSVELGEFHFGMVSGERAEYIKRHLAGCSHCTRELAQLESYLSDLSPDLEYSLAERVRVWIARLVPEGHGDGSELTPALALRGEAEKIFSYEAGDAQLTIKIQDDPRQPDRKSLLGLVIGIDPTGLRAYLWREDQEVAETKVDDLGNFVFSELVPGWHTLILSGPALEIHVQDLEV